MQHTSAGNDTKCAPYSKFFTSFSWFNAQNPLLPEQTYFFMAYEYC